MSCLLFSSVFVLIFFYCAAAIPSDIKPFQVPFDGEEFDHLRQRLSAAIYPEPVPGGTNDEWSQGSPLHIIKNLTDYLQRGFNWSDQVKKLNAMPQFQATINNHTIHFVHQRSSNKDAKPLMIIHGWPGSYWECHRIIPILTEPQDFGGKAEHAFHVICPSIPGFGYSSKPQQRGFDQMACATIFSELMSVLGYEQYLLQGGDWGSIVASLQASLPSSTSRVLGLHLNMIPAPPPLFKGPVAVTRLLASALVPWLFYSPQERDALLNVPLAACQHSGYFLEQSTQPLTLAYGLTDSPVGLLAWITEKFYRWSDHKGDMFTWISMDDLLTNFMIYWSTSTAGEL